MPANVGFRCTRLTLSDRRVARRRGIALVYVAITLVALLGLVGLASDTALVMLTGNHLQNAADASALAAVQLVRTDQDAARQLAVQIAQANSAASEPVQLALNAANAADGDVVVGYFDRDVQTFTPTTESPNAVRVVARRTEGSAGGPLPLVFAGMVGVENANVTRDAIAMIGGGTGAGLITLNRTDPCSLLIRGNATLEVNNGDIQVNSNSNRAACTNGNPTVRTDLINIVGESNMRESSVTGEIHEHQDYMPDPLAFLPEVNYVGWPNLGQINTGGTYPPGYYAGGITLNAGHNVTLEPGIYVLDGEGLRTNGNATLIAHNVMFFVVGSGVVHLNGTGQTVVTPPDSGTYEGVSIFTARDNTNDNLLNGTGLLDLQGTLYFPAAHVSVGGTGDGFGNQFIADTIEIFGTGVKTIVYDGRFPAVGNDVFLVE